MIHEAEDSNDERGAGRVSLTEFATVTNIRPGEKDAS